MKTKLLGVIAALVCLDAPHVAWATTVPPAVYIGSIDINVSGRPDQSLIISAPASITREGQSPSQTVYGYGFAAINPYYNYILPSAGEVVAGVTDRGAPASASATVQLSYYFEIFGAPGTVPLTVTAGGVGYAGLGLGGTVQASGSGQFSVSGVGVNLSGQFNATPVPYPSASLPDSFSIATTLPFTTNALYLVSLTEQASGSATDFTIVGPGGQAYMDATFQFASDFVPPWSATGYSLVFSDGAGDPINIGFNPIPPALPLFATGLGVLGLLGWRRKRKGAAAIA